MVRTIPVAALAAMICACAGAQLAAESPAFEAASVRPAQVPTGPNFGFSMWTRGGPGTQDPTRIDYHNASLNNLISHACGVADWQLSGPDWLRKEHFDIVASLPPGTTRDEFRQMVANLLLERFQFQFHRETRQSTLYSLTVAKGGPKLHPHVDVPAAAAEDRPLSSGSSRPQADAEGFPILTGKTGGAVFGNKHSQRWGDASVSQMLDLLGNELQAPVRDATGLTGRYDIDLHWVSQNYWINGQQQDAGDGPDIFAALRMQLGLNLEKAKGPVEMLVIDRLERVPTGN